MINLIWELRQLSKPIEELAVESGISPSTLLEIRDGRMLPSLAQVERLSRSLKKPISYLLSKDIQLNEIKLLFRQKANSKNFPDTDRIAQLIVQTLQFLAAEKRLDQIRSLIDQPNSGEAANLLAEGFRKYFVGNDQHRPLTDLASILTSLGVAIYVLEIKADGASALIQQKPYIFLSPRFPARMFFTLAHELGHLLAHNVQEGNAVVYEYVEPFERERTNSSLAEKFADAFASCLLLPTKGVSAFVSTFRKKYSIHGDLGDIEILALARFFGVSFEVAAKRCEDLQLLPRGGGFALYEHLKKHHGGPEGRARELSLPDRAEIHFPTIPVNVVEATLSKVETGEISIGKASEVLSIPLSPNGNNTYFNYTIPDEREIQELEDKFPSLSGAAFSPAYQKTIESGLSVLTSDNGVIYEVFPDGKRRIVKKTDPPTPVEANKPLTIR